MTLATRCLERLGLALEGSGLDLITPFDLAWYNAAVAGHPRLAPLATFGRASALGVLVGNTRALWLAFVSAWRRDEELQQSTDPLDHFVTGAVRGASPVLCGVPHRAYFSHEGGPDLVSMLHVAQVAGLARTGPAHLAVHPTHGPWFALRAVLALDLPADQLPRRSPPEVCTGCAAPCVTALGHAMSAGAGAIQRGQSRTRWAAWLAVRDACPVGRPSRYGDEQIQYHYTKDRAPLERAASANDGLVGGGPGLPG